MIKKTLTAVLAFAFSATLFTTNVAAIDDKNYSIAEVEEKLMEGCLEDDKNEPGQCECVLGGLKTDLKSKDYNLMMEFLGITLAGNFGQIWDFVVDNDMTLSELEKFGNRFEDATDRIEEACDGAELNLKLDLGDPDKT